jgi:hypothetical protein
LDPAWCQAWRGTDFLRGGTTDSADDRRLLLQQGFTASRLRFPIGRHQGLVGGAVRHQVALNHKLVQFLFAILRERVVPLVAKRVADGVNFRRFRFPDRLGFLVDSVVRLQAVSGAG